MELSKSGIHMLPEDEDAARAGIHLKDKNAEERAILDIAQTLKVFAYQSMVCPVCFPSISRVSSGTNKHLSKTSFADSEKTPTTMSNSSKTTSPIGSPS